eukprot:gnl/TRDRNA2_/TRDRNA2_169440_c1_seq1.p1 gnl/TRDRNA2_/TRDRNA2_169440_c1~~gnl/TRDRNA2_/TRDRNA2_169440_c1_seq1.p1  ORF type:complete len:162 (-),score=17.74 gnl/TRDRNA2_/TRDRNA2_169440_c1_seq1:124-609(-)
MQEMQDLTVGLKLKSEADTIKQELNTEADTIKRELKAWAAAELSEKCKLAAADSALQQLASLSSTVESHVSQPNIGKVHLAGSEDLQVSKPAATLRPPVLTPLALPSGTADHPLASPSLRSPLFTARSLQPIPAGDKTWQCGNCSGNCGSQEREQKQLHSV